MTHTPISKKGLAGITAVVTGISAFSLGMPGLAQAAPPERTYKASAGGSLVSLDATLLNLTPLASVRLTDTRAEVDTSRASNDATATAANARVGLLGPSLPLDELVASAAPLSNPLPRDLIPVNLAPLATGGAVRADVGAFYLGDDVCPAPVDGRRLIASSEASLAELNLVNVPTTSVQLASVGASTKDSRVELVGRNVQSTVESVIGDVELLDGQVKVSVDKPVVLKSTSNGAASSSSVSNNLIRIEVGGQEVATLPVGSGQEETIPVPLGLLNAEVRVSAGSYTANNSGAKGSATLDAVVRVEVDVRDGVLNSSLADLDLAVGAADTSATAPAGGVSCDTDTTPIDTDLDGLTDAEEATLGSNPNASDSDSDGLTDGAEVHTHGTSPTDADTDNGGTKDGVEVANGTDPLDGADDTGLPSLDSDSDGLTDVEEGVAGTDPANPDSDSDGLTDGAEVNTYQTNPVKPDTDNGGVPDGVEVANGTNPLNGADDLAPIADTDSDGLTDAQEAQLGTNPSNPDSDGDGLSDGREMSIGTDPMDKDTDNDGLSDGAEVNKQNRYKVATNPLSKDTDRDGLSDGAEVKGIATNIKARVKKGKNGNSYEQVRKVFTNPAKADTDGDGIKDGAELKGYTVSQRVWSTRTAKGKKVKAYSFKIGRVKSNPTTKDTDRDGRTDGQELRGFKYGKMKAVWRSNPLNWDTDFGGVSDGVEVRKRTNPSDTRNRRM